MIRNSSIDVDPGRGVRLLRKTPEAELASYSIGLVTPFVIASGDLAG